MDSKFSLVGMPAELKQEIFDEDWEAVLPEYATPADAVIGSYPKLLANSLLFQMHVRHAKEANDAINGFMKDLQEAVRAAAKEDVPKADEF